LFNRGINKHTEIETRDNIQGKIPNDQNEPTHFSNPHQPAFLGRVNQQGAQTRNGSAINKEIAGIVEKGLIHPLRASCGNARNMREQLDIIEKKRKEAHATGLQGFGNFKAEAEFERVLARRQKNNIAKALQTQAVMNHRDRVKSM